MSFFAELKRRNVFRVAAAYIVISWLLIQVLGLSADSFEAPVWVMKMIIVVLMIGFIPTLLFSWAFEITPDGIKKESEVTADQSVTVHTAKKLDMITLVALVFVVILVGYSGLNSNNKETQIAASNKHNQVTISHHDSVTANNADRDTTNTFSINQTSIAVLPFVDMSPKKDQEYFSDGISEEILNVLAKIPNLQITSRSSSFSFKGTHADIPSIAKKLGVDNILEGSVRKAGARIRITAQLIDANHDKHLWSETYDRDLSDIFKVQDEIAAAIVSALKEKLNLNVKLPALAINHVNPKVSVEAHNEYLQGRYFIEKRSNADINKALLHFTRASQLSRDFAPAWTGIGRAHLWLWEGAYGNLSINDSILRAKPAIIKALQLNPDLAEANAMMAFVKQVKDIKQFPIFMKKAIQLNPNYADAYTWLSQSSSDYPDWLLENDVDAALKLSNRATIIAPLSLLAKMNYSEHLSAFGKQQAAEKVVVKMQELDANSLFTNFALSRLRHFQNRQGEAIFYQRKAADAGFNSIGARQGLANKFADINMLESAADLFNQQSENRLKDYFLGELKSYIDKTNNLFPRSEADQYGFGELADVALLAKNYVAVISNLAKSKSCNHCDQLIFALQQTGKTKKADGILMERERRFNKVKNAGVTTWIFNPSDYSGAVPIEIVAMNIAYLKGDIDLAMQHLTDEIDKGWLIPYDYKISPMYQKLRAHPKWKALLAKSDTHAKQQREIFLNLHTKSKDTIKSGQTE